MLAEGRSPHARRSLPASALLLLSFLIVACRQPPPMPPESVRERISQILQLPVHESVYREIIYLDRERSFLFLRTVDKRVLFAVNLHVRAGIDLGEGLEVRTDPRDPAAITVLMPPARILSVDADESSIEQYFVKESGERIRLLEFSDQIAALKEGVREDARKRGVLVRADRNARTLLSNFLELAGFERIRFERLEGREVPGGTSEAENAP